MIRAEVSGKPIGDMGMTDMALERSPTIKWQRGGVRVSNMARPPENMAGFFDARVDGYDEHMSRTVFCFEEFYSTAAVQPIKATQHPVDVLDLGAGTGLELDSLFTKAPNARVTVIDLSTGMLNRLQEKYRERSDQLTLVQGSYLDQPLGDATFDYAISVMTMHHLLIEAKLDLYRKILRTLRPGGVYVEGDYVVSEDKAQRYLEEYWELVRNLDKPEGITKGLYHIDIPFTVETQVELMRQAGFHPVEAIWHKGDAVVISAVRPCNSTTSERAKVIICDYDPRWPHEFAELATVLTAHLGPLLQRVEHVGSTSVTGLAAKPIIDLDVVIASEQMLPEVIRSLAELGYEYEGDRGITGRAAFARVDDGVPWDGSDRIWPQHHLYVCPADSLELARHLAFRDYLRGHPDVARRYERLKRNLAAEYAHDRVAYTDGKSAFVQEVLAH